MIEIISITISPITTAKERNGIPNSGKNCANAESTTSNSRNAKKTPKYCSNFESVRRMPHEVVCFTPVRFDAAIPVIRSTPDIITTKSQANIITASFTIKRWMSPSISAGINSKRPDFTGKKLCLLVFREDFVILHRI